ncbi:MAG: DUF1566 domain-containing protein [Spirochaetaceae bacterium]|nr:DUF1566 domain-containing protein [Spirochaetaceae bacterium]
MAKLIRFPLKLADGTEARSLEELREHGDVESVLKHYREGTLARWLRAFGQQELAEKVAAHRNAQVECSKANLQEVFPLLGIPLEEAAFAEYCENKLSKGFVFSDADGGDLKTYGQGVSIKDKLLPFFPTAGAEAERLKEELTLWEVLETELDEGNLLVEFTCEKRNILVSLQFAREDECYKKVTNQLERLVNAFNPAVPEYDTENTQESPKKQDVQEPQNYQIGECGSNPWVSWLKEADYQIGDRGPGGGIIFYIVGKMAYEVSDVLGRYTWFEAKKMAEGFRGGGFSDWRLPTKEELWQVYFNRWSGMTSNGTYWSSSLTAPFASLRLFSQTSQDSYWVISFDDGGTNCAHASRKYFVRAVRVFSIDEQPLNK